MVAKVSQVPDGSTASEKLTKRQKLVRGIWMIVVGILVTPLALLIGYLSIHPDGKWWPITLMLIFPYGSFLLCIIQNLYFIRIHYPSFNFIAFIMVVMQIPLYGVILAVGIWKERLRKYFIILAIVHFSAVAILFISFGFGLFSYLSKHFDYYD